MAAPLAHDVCDRGIDLSSGNMTPPPVLKPWDDDDSLAPIRRAIKRNEKRNDCQSLPVASSVANGGESRSDLRVDPSLPVGTPWFPALRDAPVSAGAMQSAAAPIQAWPGMQPAWQPAPAYSGYPAAAPHLQPTMQRANAPKPKLSTAAWLVVSLGAMALVFGGVLLGWSLVTGQAQLWNFGLPILLGGQCGLILGLLMGLERALRRARLAARASAANTAAMNSAVMNAQMQWNATPPQYAPMQGGYPPAGYAPAAYPPMSAPHFGQGAPAGANPFAALAELKGQFDVLSQQMGRDAAALRW